MTSCLNNTHFLLSCILISYLNPTHKCQPIKNDPKFYSKTVTREPFHIWSTPSQDSSSMSWHRKKTQIMTQTKKPNKPTNRQIWNIHDFDTGVNWTHKKNLTENIIWKTVYHSILHFQHQQNPQTKCEGSYWLEI